MTITHATTRAVPFALDGTVRLLDLGAGNGHITLALHHRFKEIDGIDMNAAMLDYAKQSASDRAITHIRWHESAAEDVQATTDSYRLVTIGNEIQ